ncbi:MAG: hypothetical protein Q7T83_11475 [Thermodesulfovibrionales bacterium]|nr:hypothetical protein [Thermodesulfovibrionales bacterium]MDP3112473.1 hypothetical protein [Thermodesulfovibrionales bacterium]
MPKTITLRLSDDAYRKFNAAAVKDNRSISNLIETLALKKLNEEVFADKFEMEEIFSNAKLLKKLERGHSHAKLKKGNLIG